MGTLGSILARALDGAWRPEPTEVDLSVEELTAVAPLLLRTGAGGLMWWRLRDSPLGPSPAAQAFHQALRRQALQAALHEGMIIEAVAILRNTGVEPILGKGWAVAQLYPDPALRPHGDIDLFVSKDVYGRARAALERAGAVTDGVDLHRGFAELDDLGADQLASRSRLTRLGAAHIRVFGEEDHLRLLCLHMLRHGAFRPLWLCDLATALERRSSRFDWDIFLGGNRRRAGWAVCALILSHVLLGARLEGVPATVTRAALPGWLVPTVLRQWGSIGFVHHGRRTPMEASLRTPTAALRAMLERWPNGIEATVGVGGPFNGLPRLPFQIAECARRTVRFVGRRRR